MLVGRGETSILLFREINSKPALLDVPELLANEKKILIGRYSKMVQQSNACGDFTDKLYTILVHACNFLKQVSDV